MIENYRQLYFDFQVFEYEQNGFTLSSAVSHLALSIETKALFASFYRKQRPGEFKLIRLYQRKFLRGERSLKVLFHLNEQNYH